MPVDDYKTFSDVKLCTLLKASDHVAFSELFLRYNRILYIHAYKLLNHHEEARDVVQELFTALWDNHSTLIIQHNFAGFLYASIRNRIFDMLVHQKVKSKYVESIQRFINIGVTQTDHLIRTKELKAIIEKEISFLSPKMRTVFELSRKEHLSNKEIAERLDISEQTVKNQISSALKILRKKLGLFNFLIYLLFY
ncbi:RNA polymerase sigma-70 factor [Pedobacter metabolipauper]|uniref:RNA polymerase sigma-70 factor (Family 1) n=1 Tax=Pedobacter metabolipauper TaxID=425513 RepID=A0A4R6STA8_9SPHI|nr:RNA polymerase sigma-70 factor [Pedobacter metabolipauper]TDQ07105.1 RNA polymerase sigma-70 factor (family 1) [Pedobacter metabolipauper]